MDIATIITAIAAALAALILISIVWPGTVGAPWWPSTRRQVRRMLAMADVQPGDVVYDLGSGDGRVLLIAAREFGAHATGIEIDLLHVLWTRIRITLLGLTAHVEVKWGNFFNYNLEDADVIVAHLRQDTNIKLMSKLRHECQPGTRVVTNTFIFPGWEVAEIDKTAKLYLYKLPRTGDS